MSGTDDGVIGGYNLDLIRCFNCLPRQPLFAVARRLGMAEGTLKGWQQALGQMERRFRIGTSIGPPHRSCNGFPEGDALSCTAMLSLCILMDQYPTVYSGGCLLCSYVDNIQVLASSVGELSHGYLTLKVFLDLMDLTEDPRKSYAWSSSPHFRNGLRQLGWPVRLAFKDLGAQMAFSRVSRATTANDRMEQIARYWPVLKHSMAPQWFKCLAIRTAIWPKVFHAVENRLCSWSFCRTLRTRVMAAMKWNRAGASPWLRVSLMSSYDLDPGFYQIWSVVRMALRMFHIFPWLREQWAKFMSGEQRAGQGPFHSLKQALEWLHWQWLPDLALQADFVTVPFDQLHIKLLRTLVEFAWDDVVAAQLNSRADFADLHTVDRRLSFSNITDNFAHAELLATVQDGTFYTDYAISKFDSSRSGFCSLCQVEDDLTHRCLRCPRYQHLRDQHLPCVQRWHQHGPSFNLHGLVPRNEHTIDWLIYLQTLPTDFQYTFLPDAYVTYDIFVDGSCSQELGFTYAAWALVVPDLQRILAQGHLQGIHQSNNRAELVAVLGALQWKLKRPCCVRVWCDSLYVVNNIAYLRNFGTIPEHWMHRDLWLQMLVVVQAIDWTTAFVQKIPAHTHPLDARCPYEDWIVAGNASADCAAKRCNALRGPQFDALFARLTSRQQQLQDLSKSQRCFLLDMSLYDLEFETRPVLLDEEEETLNNLHDGEPNDCYIASICAIPTSSSTEMCRFEQSFLNDLAEWLSSVDILGSTKLPVSLVELLLGFIFCTNRAFPILLPGEVLPCIVYPSDVTLGALMRPTLISSSNIMKDALLHIFGCRGADLPLVKRTRIAAQIHCPVQCLVVGWPASLASRVCDAMKNFAAHPIRQPRDLARHYNHLR